MIEHKEGLVRVAVCGLYEPDEIDGLIAQLARVKNEARKWRRPTTRRCVRVRFIGARKWEYGPYTYHDLNGNLEHGELVFAGPNQQRAIVVEENVQAVASDTVSGARRV